MNAAIRAMLDRYSCKTKADFENALKEIIQEVALVGLWRSKFFDHAAFYGGTALRILFGLDRFSEDLDFTLLQTEPKFDLNPHLRAIEAELAGFGLHMEVTQKTKSRDSAVQSAFLKGNTLEHLIEIGVPRSLLNKKSDELIKIKLELDTDPPPLFDTTTHFLENPTPCAVRVVTESDLFAGKMHAILCREWKNRIKGRDWYDLIWYVQRKVPLNLTHLESRMRQSGHYADKGELTKQKFQHLLNEKIDKVNFDEAKKDVLPFIKSLHSLDLWSPEFFKHLASKIIYV